MSASAATGCSRSDFAARLESPAFKPFKMCCYDRAAAISLPSDGNEAAAKSPSRQLEVRAAVGAAIAIWQPCHRL